MMLGEETQPLASSTSPLGMRSGGGETTTVTIGLHDDDILSRNLYGIDGNTRDDVNFIASGDHHHSPSVNNQMRNWLMRLARSSMLPLIAIVILMPLNFFLVPLIGIGVSSSCGNEAALTAAAAAFTTRMRAEEHLHAIHTSAVNNTNSAAAAVAAAALVPTTTAVSLRNTVVMVWDEPEGAGAIPPHSTTLQDVEKEQENAEESVQHAAAVGLPIQWAESTRNYPPHDPRVADKPLHPIFQEQHTPPSPAAHPHRLMSAAEASSHHNILSASFPYHSSNPQHPYLRHDQYIRGRPLSNLHHVNDSAQYHESTMTRKERAVDNHPDTTSGAPESAPHVATAAAAINDMMSNDAFHAAAHRYSQAIRQTIIIDGIIQLLECFFMIAVGLCALQLFVICSQELVLMLQPQQQQHGTLHGVGGGEFLPTAVLQIRRQDFERLLNKCFSPTRALFYFVCVYLAMCTFEKLYMLLTHCNSSSILWSVSISVMIVAAITIAAAAIIDEQFRRRLHQQASAVAAKSSTLLSAARDRYHQFSNQHHHEHLHSGSSTEMNSGINGYVRRHERQQQAAQQQNQHTMGFDNSSGQALLP